MPGLLDLIDSPGGVGLLSAAFSGLAGAGRGGLLNNIGRAGLAGVSGYGNAQDNVLNRQYRQSEIDQNASQNNLRDAQIAKQGNIQGLLADIVGPGQPTSPGAFVPSTDGYGPTMPPSMNTPTGGRGLANASIDQIAGLKAAGGPDLLDAYRWAKDPLELKQGSTYQDRGNGTERYVPKIGEGVAPDSRGFYSPLPGYSASQAEIEGSKTAAVEAARFPFAVGADRQKQLTAASLDTVPIIGADGNTYQIPRSQVSGAAGAGGAPGGASNGGQPGGGQTGAFMSGRNPVTQSSAIALNDNWIKSTYQPTLDGGKTAGDLQASIQAVRNIGATTGWGSEHKANAAAVLEGLGIGTANSKMFAANSQKFQSVAMDRLQTSLAAQKGPQTEGDSTRAQKTWVSLANTPEANDFVLDFAQAKANMDQRRAQYYEQALPLAQKSGDLTRVDREWRKVQGSIWADPLLTRWAK